jgi:murein DD-endopeptidase MepM/ murein hydrolase activator NlpD
MTRRGTTRQGSVWDRLFPERQIYHRSHGQVHFITVSRRTQVLFAACTLTFLGWVAFASVNVIFKENIIVAKDQKFTVMETSYEQRMSDMQSALDDLNTALSLAEERFGETTEELERRHRQLELVREHRDSFLFNHRNFIERMAMMREDPTAPSANGTARILMHAAYREVSPRVSRPRLIDYPLPSATTSAYLSRIVEGRGRVQAVPRSLQRRVATLHDRAETLRMRQYDTAARFEEFALDRIAELEAVLHATGLNVERLAGRFQPNLNGLEALGGPLIEIDESWLNGERNGNLPDFDRQMLRISQHFERLMTLQAALEGLPLIRPIDNDRPFRFTSGFGPRRDPFTRRAAFHSGLDFAGPVGVPILATAEGVVTFAGVRGAYGRMVEVDHGNGLRTRYAHLNRITVRAGETVGFRKQIGTLGNSGRSTAPHLHYEVWFDGKVRDPEKFLEAGRYVFKIQGHE